MRLIKTVFVTIVISNTFLPLFSANGTEEKESEDHTSARGLQRQKECKKGQYFDEDFRECLQILTCSNPKKVFDSRQKKCIKCPAKKGRLYSEKLLRCERVCPPSVDIVYSTKKMKCKCKPKNQRLSTKRGSCVCKRGFVQSGQSDGSFVCVEPGALATMEPSTTPTSAPTTSMPTEDPPVQVQVCRFDENGEFETVTEDISSELMLNDLIGSCEVNCPDICFDDNFCTSDVNETSPTCACADPPVPLAVNAGEKCCAPDGNIISADACCPIGDETCCGLSIEECLQTLNPFQANLTEAALGVPPEGAEVPPLPFFLISDVAGIEAAVPGVYNATTTYGQEFTFEVAEILQNATEFNETFFAPAVDDELIDFFADLDNETSLELLLNGTELLNGTNSSDLEDFLDDREFSSYSETILDVLNEPTESDVLDTFTESESRSVVFLGRFGMGEDFFVGLADSYTDIAGERVAFLLIVSDPEAFLGNETSRRNRRLVISPSACGEAVNSAESAARAACEEEFEVDGECNEAVISTCENRINDAQAAFEKAVAVAEDAKRKGEAALALWKARTYAKCINARGCFALRNPIAIAGCIVICTAIIEGRAILVKRALQEALELAIKIAEENRDAIQRAAVSAARSAADRCFSCDCPEGECCPQCEGTDQCCEGMCISSDDCCPGCMEGEACCEGTCIGSEECCDGGTAGCPLGQRCCEGSCVSNEGNECCPACGSGQKCCNGGCIPSKECCEPLVARKLRGFEEDVVLGGRRLQLDPCCIDPEDPCCGSEDPCCGSEDPCCGSDDPCCGSDDPCCGSSDSCCGQSDCGGSTGDPHIYTFDGLRYDCHGGGDFILTTAGDAMVQGRFRKRTTRVAVTAGFAASEGPASTTVEVSIPFAEGGPVLVVNGTIVNSTLEGYEDESVVVVKTGSSSSGSFRVTYKASTLSIFARYFASFGRYMNVRVGLPSSLKASGTMGLLGSADSNATNDWMMPDGGLLAIPTSRGTRVGPAALSYCLTNWCIRNETDSLFTYYEAGTNFSFFSGCNEDLGEVVDISDPSEEAAALCGLDEACLVDALGLGLGIAQETLEEQADAATAFTTDSLLADPASVPTGRPVNVDLTIRLTPSDLANNVSEFVVYRIDSVTAVVATTPLLTLDKVGDNRFANRISVFSDMAGEEFGFQAVPVINGTEDPASSLVIESLVAVRSYSKVSGIGFTNNTFCGETPCDDGNPCTVDFCLNNICRTEPVACGTDERCDPFTGRCQDVQNLVPCVAVIDEWNNRAYNSEWSTFRERFPQRPFCLLAPNNVVQTLPEGYDMDTVNNPDGVDRTIHSTVNRDGGDETLLSDWFTICELNRLSPENVRFVGLFVDNSGSMTTGTVQASFDKFLMDVAAANLTIATVTDPNERWIDPFLTTLSPFGEA